MKADAQECGSEPWTADRGDGTYLNPVLYADYSDPDAIRVGGDYWMTASSFSHVPGLPLLHSRDLVNWTLAGHALPELVPTGHYAVPRHGCGVWAPAIRHRGGRFWIYYPDPDFGIYAVAADDPRGAWSSPRLVRAGRGLIDPCPFWDDDGRGYLMHAWARSRGGLCNRVTLHRLSDDGLGTVDAGTVVIDGDALPGWHTLEGPKLYKRNGYYYVFAPAGGVGRGYQAVFRARAIGGPYEERVVLEQGSTEVNGPHQGAWVETPEGGHWFLHFQEMPAYGRVVHLQPMEWRDDWPVIGQPVGGGRGQPVAGHAKPRAPAQPPSAPATSDEFEGASLGLQWQWQANPQAAWMSLAAVPGSLRLNCAPQPGDLRKAPHLLMQKFPGPAFTATARLSFSPRLDGDRTGLVVFGRHYAWIGLARLGGTLRLARIAAEPGEKEIFEDLPDPGSPVFLRVSVAEGAVCRFSCSRDGRTFTPMGPDFSAVSGDWVGAKVGLFASATPGSLASGSADFDWFRVAG